MENDYELVLVLAPDLKEDQLSAIKGQVVDEMTRLGAVIEKQDNWGKRDLAFEVHDYHQGFYHLIQFKADPDVPNKLKSLLKVNERVIRYIVTKRVIHPEPPKDEEKEMKPKGKEKPKAQADSEPKAEPALKDLSKPEESTEKER